MISFWHAQYLLKCKGLSGQVLKSQTGAGKIATEKEVAKSDEGGENDTIEEAMPEPEDPEEGAMQQNIVASVLQHSLEDKAEPSSIDEGELSSYYKIFSLQITTVDTVSHNKIIVPREIAKGSNC